MRAALLLLFYFLLLAAGQALLGISQAIGDGTAPIPEQYQWLVPTALLMIQAVHSFLPSVKKIVADALKSEGVDPEVGP